jgi:hypothetical protein
MSLLPGIATASSVNNELPTLDDSQALQANITQNNYTVPDNTTKDYAPEPIYWGAVQDLFVEVSYMGNSLEVVSDSGAVISTMNVGCDPISVMPRPNTMDAAVLLVRQKDDPVNAMLATLNLVAKDDTQKIVLVNMTTRQTYATILIAPADQGGIGTISNKGSVDHIFWRHDGRYMYVVTDTNLAVFNTMTCKVEKLFDLAGPTDANDMGHMVDNFFGVTGSAVAADMNPDGSAMLVFRKAGHNTYVVDRLNTTTNAIEKSEIIALNFDAANIGPLKFSPDGTKAYTFIDDMGWNGLIGVEPNLIIIDNRTMNVQMIEDALPTVKCLSSTNRMDLEISPDGNRLYMLYSSCERLQLPWAEILTYNLENHSYENTFYSDSREISGIALSYDGDKIYAANCCDYLWPVNTISILNSSNGQVIDHITTDYMTMDIKLAHHQILSSEVNT